jgi:hypothetical protein
MVVLLVAETLREEHKLRVLRRLFGPKRVEVAGGWRRLCNEELHNLYSSPNIIRVIKSERVRWAGDVASMGDEKCIQNFGQPKGNRPIGGRRRRWENNVRTDPGKIGWEGVDWIHLAQDREQWQALVNT